MVDNVVISPVNVVETNTLNDGIKIDVIENDVEHEKNYSKPVYSYNYDVKVKRILTGCDSVWRN